MTRRFSIAVLPGDGIGPEVTGVALHVLDAALGKDALEWNDLPCGAGHFRRSGVALPSETLDICRSADAVYLAAVGLPDVRRPDGTEVQPEIMVTLRRVLGLYAAVRPIKLYPGAPTPLKNTGPGIDFIILRENLEGLFASYGGGCLVGDAAATDTIVITRAGTEKVSSYAFHLAQRRQGRPLDGKRLVTCVDKANVFRSFAFFRKVFFDVAAKHPDIAADAVYVDAMSLYMVQNPWAFDVMVMENEFGDILSDLGAGLVGGLGLAPSAEIGEQHALFQPSHGTAPQLAGRNVANPLAMILSGAMMLDWLGERHGEAALTRAGQRVEKAVAAVLAEGRVLTADLGGKANTTDVGEAVVAALKNLP